MIKMNKSLFYLFIEALYIYIYIYIYNKAINKLASNMSSNLFSYSTTRSSRRLGDDQKLEIMTPKNNFYFNSLFFKGIKAFNELTLDIRQSQSISIFKRRVFHNCFWIYCNLLILDFYKLSSF